MKELAVLVAVAWLYATVFRSRVAPSKITRARRRSLRKNRYVLPGERS